MKLLLIQNQVIRDFSAIYEFKDCVVEFEDTTFAQTDPYKFGYLQGADPLIESIVEYIENRFTDVDGIVISNWLQNKTENATKIEKSAFQFATHIRLSNTDVKYLPIIILSELSIEDLVRIGKDKVHILQCLYGIKIQPLTFNTIKLTEDETDSLDSYSFEDEGKKNIFYFLKEFGNIDKKVIEEKYNDKVKGRIKVESSGISSHEIANEWGAYQMAKTAELNLKKFSFPKTLYFKYLISEIDQADDEKVIKITCKPFWDNGLKILFIDDNHDKGWDECLRSVFQNKVLKDSSKKVDLSTSVKWDDKFISQIEKHEYDIVLLDYYLGKEKGIDVLKKIKEANPIIPVIIFTASNKAWNMDELYQAGADGYYVKEHPETASDPDFSIKNFENFHKTVEACLLKGELLKKYWLKIQDIKKSKFIIDKLNQKNKERIEERLMMFLGLLKRAYQQTVFDKDTFFYSEWELAFLTLWSTLNEIQEVFYEKSTGFENPKNSGQIENHHPDQTDITKDWTIIGQTDKFIWREPHYNRSNLINEKQKYKYDTYSNYKFDKEKKKFTLVTHAEKFKDFYETRLFIQIAFLIESKYDYRDSVIGDYKKANEHIENIILNNLLPGYWEKKKKQLLDSILELNEFRNHLYLTHGESESINSFRELYRDSRKNQNYTEKLKTKIEELFEIVFLLCRGKECTWKQ